MAPPIDGVAVGGITQTDGIRYRTNQKPGELQEASMNAGASKKGPTSIDRNSLWFRYKHLLTVPMTLIAGVLLTSIMIPYFINPLLLNVNKNNPHLTGFAPFDAFLGFVVPFFSTMVNSENYGIYPMGYFITTHLGWQMAGALESSRADAPKSFFVHYFTLVVVVALAVSSYIFVPLLWIVPYLSFNKLPASALSKKDVAPKAIHEYTAYACFAVVTIGFTPFLAGAMLGHDASKFTLNTALFFTSPLLWQLLYAPVGRYFADSLDPVKGHVAAMNALLMTAGGAMAWHMYAAIAVYRDPSIVPHLLGVLAHYEGHLHTILFIFVDVIFLWLSFVTIPLAQEGPKAALLFALLSILVGPGAAVALYFFWRERGYLEVASRS